LNAAGVKGTFFFNGNNYGCIYSDNNPDKIRYVVNNNHQAASHTWAHKDLTTLTWDMIHDECWRVEQALLRLAGVYPAFMRPPYGNYNDLVHQAATVRNQSLVLWDLDAGDGLGKSPEESQGIYDEVISRHPSTILALNHETHERSAHQVLPYAIEHLKNAGYRLVTLAECVGQAPYQYVTNPQQGTWTC
jgi:peptidoglycan/xylan/chitin deacetylase (PgdA/CDA1 family)